jgi:uncharacterized membrane protein YjjP (DUF1212 family)
VTAINPKVTAAVLAAAVTTIIAWLLKTAGIELPNEVQGAITTILVFVAGYLTSADSTPGDHAA